MPGEATSRPVQHQRSASLNQYLNTSNATSNHFRGGQQRPWMLTSQLFSGAEMPQWSGERSKKAPPAPRGIEGLVNGNWPDDDGQRLPEVQLQQAQDTMGVAQSRRRHLLQAAGHISGPTQMNKRPRLDLQTRVQPPIRPQLEAETEAAPAPWYTFVSSPTQMVYPPAASASVMSPTSARPMSSTSPNPVSTLDSLQQRLMQPHSHSANHFQYVPPGTYPSARPQTPRRQLGTSSMPGSGPQDLAPPVQQNSQTEMRSLQYPGFGAPTNSSAGEPSTQQKDPKRMSTKVYLPQLISIVADSSIRDLFTDWARQRVTLLEEACNNEDWFYLTLHQIFCWRNVNRNAMHQLGIVDDREQALASLEAMLLPNDRLKLEALEWFAHFPIDPAVVLSHKSSDTSLALHQIHIFLDNMGTDWSKLYALCLVRHYPPSPYELYARLGLSSTVLQTVFFTFVFRQLEGADSGKWIKNGAEFFKRAQSQLVDKMNRINIGLPEAPSNMDTSLAQFAGEYFAHRNKYASRSVMKSVTTQSMSPAMQTTTPVSTKSNLLPPSLTPPAARVPANSANTTSASSPAAPAGVLSVPTTGVATHMSQRSVFQPQSASSSIICSAHSTGPRQQSYIQGTTQISAIPSNHVASSDRRAPGSSDALAHAPSASNFSPTVPAISYPPSTQASLTVSPSDNLITSNVKAPARIRRQQTHLSPSLLSTQNGQGVQPMPNTLLPLAGKLTLTNTRPNPDAVDLHQARLHSPEPRIISEELSAQYQQLFQVLHRFVMPPQLLTRGRSYYNWQIDIPPGDLSRRAKDLPIPANRPTSRGYRAFKKGSVVYRLRCVLRLGASNSVPTEAEWSTATTHFPSICFISLNMSEIPIRRKSQFGKTLPCDLMPGIKAGLNNIEMSVQLSSEDSHTFAVAVEQIEVLDFLQCRGQVRQIEQPVSLAAIVSSLIPANENDNDDDDIKIVDLDIGIDLIDPFTAQICRLPVRGRTCTHRECFDLYAFLQSRPTKVKGVPLSNADEWKCPICNKDARPQSLLLDGFLMGVCTQLRARGQADEVRAIRVTADGAWRAKTAEATPQGRKDAGAGTAVAWKTDPERERERAGSTPSKDAAMGEARSTPLVIELDDD